MLFGGVPTGKINANEDANVVGIMRVNGDGLLSRPRMSILKMAKDKKRPTRVATIGMKMDAVTVLEQMLVITIVTKITMI